MTLNDFRALSSIRQALHVLACGTYLARRWNGDVFVNLYHVPDQFFVELYYHAKVKQICQIRAFASAAPLADYAALVRLPDEWT